MQIFQNIFNVTFSSKISFFGMKPGDIFNHQFHLLCITLPDPPLFSPEAAFRD